MLARSGGRPIVAPDCPGKLGLLAGVEGGLLPGSVGDLHLDQVVLDLTRTEDARELYEEINATATSVRFLGIVEDIFDWAGQRRHELWLLYDVDSPAAYGARGFSRGTYYTQSGELVASVAQEGLVRIRRKEG